jgi:hypothetical protein
MKTFSILFFAVAISVSGRGQAVDTANTKADSTSPTSAVTLGISVASNASYYGQRSAEATPYVATVAQWKHSSGFYLTGLAYKLLQNDEKGFASAYSAATGFDIAMKKGWSTEIGYGYTYFPGNSPFLQAANPHSATLAFAHDGLINAKLEGNYSFGHTNDFFTTFTLSKAATLSKQNARNTIGFNPAFDVTGGTQRFYSYYLAGKNFRDSVAGVLLDPVLGEYNSQDTTATKVTSFTLLSYNLTLPLTYQWNSCMIELSAQFSMLSKQTRSKQGELNTFFTASFYYQL